MVEPQSSKLITRVRFSSPAPKLPWRRHAPLPSVGRMFRPDLQDALRDRDAVLRSFLAADGTLTSIPTKIRKRLVVLDLLSQEFEPGERLAEPALGAVGLETGLDGGSRARRRPPVHPEEREPARQRDEQGQPRVRGEDERA